MNIWLWIAILLMVGTAGLLFTTTQRDRPPPGVYRRFAEALRGDGANISHFFNFEKPDANTRLIHLLERFSSSEMEEMQRLLVQAGWGNPQTRLYFLVGGWLVPLAMAVLAGIYSVLDGSSFTNVLFHAVFVFAFVFIAMRRLLRWRASQRQQVLRKEVVAFLHLLRMLFDAGLSFEHTLQVIEQQGSSLIPNLAKELGVVLKRIQAGQERGEALAEMAEPLEIPELNDTIGMLKQVTRYGGNIRDSLNEYTQLVEARQISELREYVSKLSAKMTVVMVAFLFPALMIFVAGPGFVGLARALKGL
ncbi:MAG: type II secretion system F family protein [Methylophilaceae bacterium]|jgi:tight adherence protein C|nr:type II secretion system F family protein [Methylophilaceae bacterium]